MLGPYGLTLTPQPPADLHDAIPTAIFEADPEAETEAVQPPPCPWN